MTFHIKEQSDCEGRVYFKAVGFLGGRSYRGVPTRSMPRSDVLRIMTRNPNARHPADWSDPPCHVQVYMSAEQEIQEHLTRCDDYNYRNSHED